MDLKAFGLQLKKVREEKGLTQEELAEKAGCTSTHISVLERGEKVPKLDTFVSIVNALKVSADTVLKDVVDYAVISEASELSILISKEPIGDQKRLLRALEILLKK